MQLTYEMAVAELRKAVETRGADYVYPVEWKNQGGSCKYVYNGQPGCIVGQVFHQLGLRIENISDQGSSVGSAARDVGLKADDGVIELLGRAQCKQDEMMPWGEAVDLAIQEEEASRVDA